MRVTTKGRYTLRAVCEVAAQDGKPISIKNLSEAEELSAEFLEQLFFALKKEGILKSFKGPGGGFALNKPAQEISVHDILMAVGEGYDITPCVGDLSEGAKSCPRENFDIMTCWTQDFWRHTYNLIEEYFTSVSLYDVMHKTGYKEKFPLNGDM